MKVSSFAIFSSSMLSTAAHAPHSSTEQSVLLQTKTKSELMVTMSDSDVFEQLNKQMDQIRKLATDHQGQKLPKDAKTYLKEIKDLAGGMLEQLRIAHTASKKAVTDALAEVNKCNTDADLTSVTQSLKAAQDVISAHDSCRVKEAATYKVAEGSCSPLPDALDKARDCSAPAEKTNFAKYEKTLGIIEAVQALESQKTACGTFLEKLEDENKKCQEAQLDAEKKTCAGHLRSHTVCGTLDDCYAAALKQHDENVCVDMVAPRDARKSQALAVNTITCMVDKLLNDDTTGHTAESLAACDSSKMDEAKITGEFHIQCEKPADKLKCDWPANYLVAPGHQLWFDAHYKAKDWFALATNDLKSRAPIADVLHTCDELPALSSNTILPSRSDKEPKCSNPKFIEADKVVSFPSSVVYSAVQGPSDMPFKVHGQFKASPDTPEYSGILHHVANGNHQRYEGWKIGLDGLFALRVDVSQSTSYYGAAKSTQQGLADDKWHTFVCTITKDYIQVEVDGELGKQEKTSDYHQVQDPKEFGKVVNTKDYVIGQDGSDVNRRFKGEIQHIYLC